MRIATIGYEGATLENFLTTLKEAGVEQLLDVRDFPSSRKPGFSKTALSQALAREGISYVHLKGLGTPKAGRIAAKKNRRQEFHDIYRGQIDSPEGQLELARAIELAADKPSCLMCYERDFDRCHRLLIIDEMEKRGKVEVDHLLPPLATDYPKLPD